MFGAILRAYESRLLFCREKVVDPKTSRPGQERVSGARSDRLNLVYRKASCFAFRQMHSAWSAEPRRDIFLGLFLTRRAVFELIALRSFLKVIELFYNTLTLSRTREEEQKEKKTPPKMIWKRV
ncbi:hypothetical protein TNCV_3732041 [Trichonephila clavipes]|nr:hypothetical protein TNCV_3732041 [Trichonephila clavipes]